MDDIKLKLTDEDFIISARKACANWFVDPATGAYLGSSSVFLEEALQRLERANALIDDIKAQVGCGGVKHVGKIYSMIEDRHKT